MNKDPLRKLFLLGFQITNNIPGCVDCKPGGGLYVLNHPMKGLDLVLMKSLFPAAKVVVGKHRMGEMGRFFDEQDIIPTGGSVERIIAAIGRGHDVFIFYRRIGKISQKRSIRLVMEATGCPLFMVNISTRRRPFDQVFSVNNNLTKFLYFARLVLFGNTVRLSGRRIERYDSRIIAQTLQTVFGLKKSLVPVPISNRSGVERGNPRTM